MPTRRKNQHNKRQKPSQASRRLNPAPERIRVLVDLVNMIPPGLELLDALWVRDQINEWRSSNWFKWTQKELQDKRLLLGSERMPTYASRKLADAQEWVSNPQERLDKGEDIVQEAVLALTLTFCVSNLPQEIKDYVWQFGEQGRPAPFDIIEARERYIFIREGYNKLRLIPELANYPSRYRALIRHRDLKISAQIMIDDDGELYIAKDRFAAAIDGIEASRIRECSICFRIFWAGRITQQCCSTACAHALRNRRYRANYKEYLIRRHAKENGAAQNDSRSSSSKKSKSKSKKGKKV